MVGDGTCLENKRALRPWEFDPLTFRLKRLNDLWDGLAAPESARALPFGGVLSPKFSPMTGYYVSEDAGKLESLALLSQLVEDAGLSPVQSEFESQGGHLTKCK